MPQLLSLCSRAREPQLLSPCAASTKACAPWTPCATVREATTVRSLRTTTGGKLVHQGRPSTAKKNNFLNQTAFKAQLYHTLAIELETLPLTILILNDPPEKGNIIVPTFKGFHED